IRDRKAKVGDWLSWPKLLSWFNGRRRRSGRLILDQQWLEGITLNQRCER
ncbi:MAG: hypothetical protein RIR86_896, partial [Acidobacteriota bacterium]